MGVIKWNFEITRMISVQIALHSVQLQLLIIVDQRKLTLTLCAIKSADRVANSFVPKYQPLLIVIQRQKLCILYSLKRNII